MEYRYENFPRVPSRKVPMVPLHEGLFQRSNGVTGSRYQGCVLFVGIVRMELRKVQRSIRFGAKSPFGIPGEHIAMLIDFPA